MYEFNGNICRNTLILLGGEQIHGFRWTASLSWWRHLAKSKNEPYEPCQANLSMWRGNKLNIEKNNNSVWYPPVILHNCGKSPIFIGTTHYRWSLSIANCKSLPEGKFWVYHSFGTSPNCLTGAEANDWWTPLPRHLQASTRTGWKDHRWGGWFWLWLPL